MKLKVSILWILLFFSSYSMASLVINSTKILFLGNEQEKVVIISNDDPYPTLVQSWITKNEKRSQDFIVTPPLFRLEAKKDSSIRIVKMAQNLPQDRESMYWLNVKGVPPNDPNAKNTITFSINSRIVLFYRPTSLMNKEKIENAHTSLIFSLSGKHLIAKNPTPYYITLSGLKVGNESMLKIPSVIAPFSEEKYLLKSPINQAKVTWIALSEQGTFYPEQTKQIK